jgi:hypothetical protein
MTHEIRYHSHDTCANTYVEKRQKWQQMTVADIDGAEEAGDGV